MLGSTCIECGYQFAATADGYVGGECPICFPPHAIIGTTSSLDQPPPTAKIFAALPRPPKGERWVGPLQPLIETTGMDPDTWAGLHVGGEYTSCYRPRAPRGGAVVPDGWAQTDTSGRSCVRTRAGWWVAVPADRPSGLAGQVAQAGGDTEVYVDTEGIQRILQPIRDRWDADGRGPVYWPMGGLRIEWHPESYHWATGAPGRLVSRGGLTGEARRRILTAAGISSSIPHTP